MIGIPLEKLCKLLNQIKSNSELGDFIYIKSVPIPCHENKCLYVCEVVRKKDGMKICYLYLLDAFRTVILSTYPIDIDAHKLQSFIGSINDGDIKLRAHPENYRYRYRNIGVVGEMNGYYFREYKDYDIITNYLYLMNSLTLEVIDIKDLGVGKLSIFPIRSTLIDIPQVERCICLYSENSNYSMKDYPMCKEFLSVLRNVLALES